MQLAALDWAIIVAYFALSLGIGLAYKSRASESFVEYFASGRSLPWWIAGTSMVATTFAADTPLWVTGVVAKNGLAGNWFWWAFALGGMLTVFIYAKLWRRSEVVSDVELVELRYGGRPAAFLRGFRAVYVAVVMNSVIIGWVTLAMVTVLRETVFIDLPAGSHIDFWLVAGLLAITGLYSVISGMWGVAITDAVQFVLAMTGCIALAVVAVVHVGGTDALRERVIANFGNDQAFSYLPDFSAREPWMPIGVFVVMVFGQWWANGYPGNEPGGGGYIVQRMASCKDERHAVKATLWFQLAHYCLRPWPWIMVAFAALAMHPEMRSWALPDAKGLPNPESGYPIVMRELAPIGLRGLMLVTFFAAFMSTISTQMNWGASYVVNDLYRRFFRPDADARQFVRVSRIASSLVLLLGGAVSYYMMLNQQKIDDAWQLLMALGAGLGSVLILRWFWWRINAWSEIAAMAGSITFYLALAPLHLQPSYHAILVALASLLLWLVVTLLTRPESDATLLTFFRKVRPDGPGWTRIRGLAPEARPDGTLAASLLCALLGTVAIWLTLPGVGAVIFGEWTKATLCLLGAAIALAVLLRMLPALQPRAPVDPQP